MAKPESKGPKPEAPKKDDGLGGATGCVAKGCKTFSHRFGFCAEHFDHFKFGLIKKTGEQVSDYEKKYDHFMVWKAKQKSAKVA